MEKRTLMGFSICAVVLIVLASFPSVVGYQQIKFAKPQEIKETLQILKESPKYQKSSYAGRYLLMFLINLIFFFSVEVGNLKAAFIDALLWPLTDTTLIMLFLVIIFLTILGFNPQPPPLKSTDR